MNVTPCPAAADLAQAISAAWQEGAPADYPSRLQLRHRPPVRRHTYSCTYEFVILNDTGHRRIIAKVAFGDRAAGPLAAYQALQRLHEHFRAHPHLGVPRALLALTHPPTLVMARAPGRQLLHTLRRLRGARDLPQIVITRVQQAGRWLAILHQMPCPPQARPATDPALRWQQARERLQASPVPANILTPCSERLQQQLPTLPTSPRAPLHGDYTLRNIICHHADLLVLDTDLRRAGPAELDVAAFLAALHYIDWGHMLVGSPLYKRQHIAALGQHFVQAYMEAGSPLDVNALPATVALHLWQRWAEFSVYIPRRYPAPLSRVLLQRIHRHFGSAIMAMLAP